MKNITLTTVALLFVAAGMDPALAQSSRGNTFSNSRPVTSGLAPTTAAGAASSYTVGSSDSVAPLVIEFTQADDATHGEMEEDLSVMTRVIEKSLEEGLGDDVPPDRMGIRMWATYGGRSIRAMHLEGFGALFMIKVNVPVLGPSPVEKKEPVPAGDSEWERARQEIYGLNSPDAERWTATPGPEYNAAEVEVLKKTLLQALKNGSHIRHLKAEEFIGITVFGAPLPAPGQSNRRATNSLEPSRPTVTVGGASAAAATVEEANPAAQPRTKPQLAANTTRASQQGTVLTLRVRKADADEFSKGTIDFEAFQKKTTMNAYVGNGYGVSSVNSWSRRSSSGTAR